MPDRAELESLVSQHPSAEQQLLRAENAAELRRAVLKIPSDYRQVLVLHDMEELSTSEVAKIMALREGTVRVRLHRARAFLRNELALRPKARKRHSKNGAGRGNCRHLFAALSDYIDRELDPAQFSELESHLGGCVPCKAYLDSLRETVRRCRQLGTPEARTNLRRQLRELVQTACASDSR